MRAFRGEFPPRRTIVGAAERDRRTVDGIEIVPYPEFREELHGGNVM